MVTSSDLIKLIKDKENNFTEEELKKILDAELEKDESEIDADLVECCLEALEDGKKASPAKKEKKKSLKFILFAGAAAALIFVNIFAFSKVGKNADPANQVVHITSPSQTTPVTPSQTVIVEYETQASPTKPENPDQLKGPDEETDALVSPIKEQLKNAGYENIVLPAELLTLEDATVKTNGDEAIFAALAYEKSLNIRIAKNQPAPSMTAPGGTESKTINVNGVSVFITNENGVSVITYRKDSLNYQIIVKASLEEAAEIAKTIK